MVKTITIMCMVSFSFNSAFARGGQSYQESQRQLLQLKNEPNMSIGAFADEVLDLVQEDILGRNASAIEVRHALNLMFGMITPPKKETLNDQYGNLSDESKRIIRSRINSDFAKRNLVLSVALDVMNKYKNVYSSDYRQYTQQLETIAKVDWSTHNRRLALTGYLAFHDSKTDKTRLLQTVAQSDGTEVFDASYRYGERVTGSYSSGYNSSGEPVFNMNIPTGLDFEIFTKEELENNFPWSYGDVGLRTTSFSGTREQILAAVAEHSKSILEQIDAKIRELSNPKLATTKSVHAKVLRFYEDRVLDYQERCDKGSGYDNYYCEEYKVDQVKVNQMESSGIPSVVIEKLQEAKKEFAKFQDGSLIGNRYHSHLANGVTPSLSRNTRTWANELLTELNAGNGNMSLQTILANAKQEKIDLLYGSTEEVRRHPLGSRASQ